MKKNVSLLVFFIVFGCNKNQTIDSKSLIDNVYYSIQDGDFVYCSVYYHFTSDSLYVYNSATGQKLKFKINYKNNYLELSNESLDNYHLELYKSENGIVLSDKSNFINFDDTIVLKKIDIGEDLHFFQLNKDYAAKIQNANNTKIDSIWLNFVNNKQVCLYTKFKKNEKIFLDFTHYDFIELSNKLKIIEISGQTGSFLLEDIENGNFVLSSSSCNRPYKREINFINYENELSEKFINDWVKIKSQNEYELPKNLIFKDSLASLDEEKMNFSIGLKNKFILLGNGKYFEVNKITKDSLELSIINSAKQLETAIYKLNY